MTVIDLSQLSPTSANEIHADSELVLPAGVEKTEAKRVGTEMVAGDLCVINDSLEFMEALTDDKAQMDKLAEIEPFAGKTCIFQRVTKSGLYRIALRSNTEKMISMPASSIDRYQSDAQKMKAWRDAVDNKTMGFDRCLALAPLRTALLQHEKISPSNGMLHAILEVGDFTDETVDECIRFIESGEWRTSVHNEWTTEEDAMRQVLIVKQLRGLSQWEREMVTCGNTMTEGVFAFLVTGDPAGVVA